MLPAPSHVDLEWELPSGTYSEVRCAGEVVPSPFRACLQMEVLVWGPGCELASFLPVILKTDGSWLGCQQEDACWRGYRHGGRELAVSRPEERLGALPLSQVHVSSRDTSFCRGRSVWCSLKAVPGTR